MSGWPCSRCDEYDPCVSCQEWGTRCGRARAEGRREGIEAFRKACADYFADGNDGPLYPHELDRIEGRLSAPATTGAQRFQDANAMLAALYDVEERGLKALDNVRDLLSRLRSRR